MPTDGTESPAKLAPEPDLHGIFDSVLMRTVDGYLYFYPVYLSLR